MVFPWEKVALAPRSLGRAPLWLRCSLRPVDGQLFVAEGAWLDGKGTVVAAPRVLAEAPPSKSIVVNERGEDEDVGRDIREPRDGGARTRERQESDKDGGAP